MEIKDRVLVSGKGESGRVVVPEGVKKIAGHAFFDCDGIKEVVLPESLEEILWGAFERCSIESIEIPKNVVRIGREAFKDCVNLKKIIWNARACESVGDCSEEEQERSHLRERTFEGCNAVEEIVVGDDVVSLPAYALCILKSTGGTSSYKPVSRVTIGKKLVQAGPNAFLHVQDVAEVHYNGDLWSWREIGMGNSASLPVSARTNLYINGHLYTPAFFIMNSILIKYWGTEEKVVVPKGVTEICDRAFSGNERITSVTIPEGVKKIGEGAFRDCIHLKFAELPAGLEEVAKELFAGDVELGLATISEGVKKIGERAFEDCRSLQILPLPASLEEIGEWAFRGCGLDFMIIIPENVTRVGKEVFAGCPRLTSVYWYARACKEAKNALSASPALNTIEIGKGVEHIPAGAFSGLMQQVIQVNYWGTEETWKKVEFEYEGNLVDRNTYMYGAEEAGAATLFINGGKEKGAFTVPGGITEIGCLAFAHNKELTSVTIPEGVVRIGESAFMGCANLEEVVLPGSLREIGPNAFSGCSRLPEIVLPEGLKKIDDIAFIDCPVLWHIDIPDSVTYIGKRAFRGDRWLMSAKLPAGLEEMGNEVFFGCEYLKQVTIPEGVKKLGDAAFWGCIGLKEIELPESLEEIGEGAFFGCERLKCITLHKNLTRVKDKAFMGTKIKKIYYTGTEESWNAIDFGRDADPIGKRTTLYIGEKAKRRSSKK